MTSLSKIIISNLEMLSIQETELIKSLHFVRKAKELFQSQNASSGTKRRGRPTKAGITPSLGTKKRGRPAKASAVPSLRPSVRSRGSIGPKFSPKVKPSGIRRKETIKGTAKPAAPKGGENRVTHLSKVVTFLKQSTSPVNSREIINALFEQQKENTDIKRYGKLIYPILTKAYKSGVLSKLEDGKICLP